MFRDDPIAFERFRWPWSRQSQPFPPAQTCPSLFNETRHLPGPLHLPMDSTQTLTAQALWRQAVGHGTSSTKMEPANASTSQILASVLPLPYCLSCKTLWKHSRIAYRLQNERRLSVHEQEEKKVSDHPCIENDSRINSSMLQTCSRRASQFAISP